MGMLKQRTKNFKIIVTIEYYIPNKRICKLFLFKLACFVEKFVGKTVEIEKKQDFFRGTVHVLSMQRCLCDEDVSQQTEKQRVNTTLVLQALYTYRNEENYRCIRGWYQVVAI